MMASSKTSPTNRDLTTSQYWTDEWRRDGVTNRRCRGSAPSHPLPLLLARTLESRDAESTDICEIGCAPGTLLSQFAELRPRHRYHGVDFSASGIEQTRLLLNRCGVDATLHCGDVREFDPEHKFGLVYSCGLIEHFTNPAEMLAQHVRLCAPRGLVGVSVPNHRGWVQQWFINQLDPEALESHNLSIMQVDALRDICERVGLHDVVAGGEGPSTIRSRTIRSSLRAKLLRRIAQAWNVTNRLGPRLSARPSVIWACGRVA